MFYIIGWLMAGKALGSLVYTYCERLETLRKGSHHAFERNKRHGVCWECPEEAW